MVTIKIFFLAILFVITSGALFTEYFKKQKLLSLLASFFAIISSFYLFKSISADVVNNIEYNRESAGVIGAVADLTHNSGQQLETSISTSSAKQSSNDIQSTALLERETNFTKESLYKTSSNLSVNISQPKTNPWLTSNLYGSDNDLAMLRSVKIESRRSGYVATIVNQFNFQCDITFDLERNPEYLNNCKSLNDPQPICNPDMPESFCAKASGCFMTENETNPDCFEAWEVKESKVSLRCTMLKTEHVCNGTYTLVNGNYNNMSQFTIARRL